MKNSIYLLFVLFFQFGPTLANANEDFEEVSIGVKIEQLLAAQPDSELAKDPIIIAELINLFEACGYYNDSFLQADFSRSSKHLVETMFEHFSHYLLAGKMKKNFLLMREFVYPIEKLNEEQVEQLDQSGVAKLLRPYLVNRLDFRGFVWGKLLSPYIKEQKQIQMYQRLKSFGVSVQDLENEGSFPLHIALRQQHMVFARLLMADGARSELRDKRQCTPKIIAKAKGMQFEES